MASQRLETNLDKSWLNLNFRDADHKVIKKPEEFQIDKSNYPPSGNNSTIVNRIKGSLFGLALGDAVGAHVEFRPNSFLVAYPVKDLEGGGTWGLDKGQFTDDTSMALCLASSLIVCQGLFLYDQLVRYKWWYKYGYMSSTGDCFDIGSATKNSLDEFISRQRKFAHDSGISLEEMDDTTNRDPFRDFNVKCSSAGVAGNGSLMRLAPVPLFFYQDPKIAVEYSGSSGEITHGDAKARDACRYYGALIVAALQGARKEVLLDDKFYENHKAWFGEIPLDPDIRKIAEGSYKKSGGYADNIRGKAYVVDALEAALWAFWDDNGSFKDGVLKAVNLGDDTDTTAAIYGQLAGAHYGYNNLPENWLQFVYAAKFIDCISCWIVYEGEQWFASKKTSDCTTLINSDYVEPHCANTLYSKRTGSFDYRSMTNLSTCAMKRKAIDPCDALGCFYDGWTDRIITTPQIQFTKVSSSTKPIIKCFLKRGDEIQWEEVLRTADVDAELWLSIISGLIEPKGIASVVDYPDFINEHTRILYYSYKLPEECLPDQNSLVRQMNYPNASHIITGIERGVDVIAIMKLYGKDLKSSDQTITELCECLNVGKPLSKDTRSLDQMVSVRVYSNISVLTTVKTVAMLQDMLFKVEQIKADHRPCTYRLEPIIEGSSNEIKERFKLVSFGLNLKEKIEDNLLSLSKMIKVWRIFQQTESYKILDAMLNKQLKTTQDYFKQINDEYESMRKWCQKIIPEVRRGYKMITRNEIQQWIDDKQRCLTKIIGDFSCSLRQLKQKASLISDLKSEGFKYLNVADYDIKQTDSEKQLEEKLQRYLGPQLYALCSNDTLNESYSTELQDLRVRMSNELRNNQNLKLVYADFSYCNYQLNTIKAISAIDDKRRSYPELFVSRIPAQSHQHGTAAAHIEKDINILLVGKTRAGKTTLVNMIDHYLKFNEFRDVTSDKNILSPRVPFCYYLKNDYDDRIIHIGREDFNEDYEPSNSTITQNCKSHYFKMKSGISLQIIDTPGINISNNKHATNQRRIQQILGYISGINYLNAICVILEPEKELAEYTELLKTLLIFLGPKAFGNLAFCFMKHTPNNDLTNENGMVLQRMLHSISAQIPCDNRNTFYLDSDSYVCLCTNGLLRGNVSLEASWVKAKESLNALLKYAQNSVKPCYIGLNYQKNEYARIKIIQMIRPILESIRCIILNRILYTQFRSNILLELHPKYLSYPAAICRSCRPLIFSVRQFNIPYYEAHHFVNECRTCPCASTHHVPIAYALEYKTIDTKTYDVSQMENLEKSLFEVITCFGYFLHQKAASTSDDILLNRFNLMLNNEYYLLLYSSINDHLQQKLIKLKDRYTQEMDRLKSNQKYVDHMNEMDIGSWIQYAESIPMIQRQMYLWKKAKDT